MRGSIKRRSKGSWTLIFDLPRSVDGKRRQKWVALHGTKREAQQELTRILRDMDQRTYVEPTSLLTREYLETWLRHIRAEVSGKTFERYTEIVQLHLIP